MFIPNLRRLTRRRFLSLAAATGSGLIGISAARAQEAQIVDITNPAPFFPQGGTGDESSANCGPSSVAMAINYSGVAYPTTLDVRATLGMNGATNIDQWAWLLDAYGAPWYPIWSQPEMDVAIRNGYVIVVAAWMADLTAAPDFLEPWSVFWGQSGRYEAYAKGHGMLISGIADEGLNYLVHDPNVFPDSGTFYYGDGAPKGAFRRYNSWELWNTIAGYADGLGLAVAPKLVVTPAPQTSVRTIRPDKGERFDGPGGGHAPERGDRGVTGEITPVDERGVISIAVDEGEGVAE